MTAWEAAGGAEPPGEGEVEGGVQIDVAAVVAALVQAARHAGAGQPRRGRHRQVAAALPAQAAPVPVRPPMPSIAVSCALL